MEYLILSNFVLLTFNDEFLRGETFQRVKSVGKINKLTVYTAQVFFPSSQKHDAAPNTNPTHTLPHSLSKPLCLAKMLLVKLDTTCSNS